MSIAGNERLVIVLGMAHSGTTILTYILKQHPDLICSTDGDEAWILENTWLMNCESGSIKDALQANPDKRVLLKRPWNEVRHPDWMRSEMPDAKFIYCYREFLEIAPSWHRSDMIDRRLKSGTLRYKRGLYNQYWQAAMDFGKKVSFFRVHDHRAFVNNPQGVIGEMRDWLGLSPFDFDLSQVSSDASKSIKDFLRRQ